MSSQVSYRVEPAGVKLRPDIQWSEHRDGQRWVARDPLRGSFFCFTEVEYTAVTILTSAGTLQEALADLQNRFPQSRMEIRWLELLLAKLRQFHLLVPEGPAHVQRLVASNAGNRTQWLKQLMSPLSIRIPLFDPSFVLQRTHHLTSWLFHRTTVIVVLLFGMVTLSAVVRSLFASSFSLPQELQRISIDRIALGLGCYIVAKCLHEIGHAVACVRQGARCNEIGIMLLCFTPSLYCDTTDSWRLPSKWQRAAIAAAGMYVELIIASCAALVWLVTKEGTLHYLAASTMLVCSISTLLINMNPLLKYDGYYILSDLWNVPNLAEQGSEAFRKVVVSFFSTDKRNAAPARVVSALDANTGLLAGYSVAAFSYRIFVLGVILWLGWVTLVPLGLGLVAVLLTMIVAVGFVANYARSLTKLVGELKSSGTIRFIRLFLAGAVVVGVIVLICSFPLPVRVQARGVADFAGKIAQFAPEDAQLVYAASPGHGCRKGETLFRLRAPELELELLKLEGEIDLLATQIDALESRQANDSSAVFKLPALQERLLDRRARIEAVQLIRSELTIQAQEAGTLIASQAYAPTVLTAHHDDRVRVGLASTSRIGAFVQRGARLGWLVTDDSVVVNALVPEEDMRRLVLGMQVDIRFDSRPWTNVEGRVTTIATEPLSEIPSELLGDGAIVATRTPAGALATEKPHYEVEIQVARRTIDASELSGQTARKRDMLPGSLATVQIQTHSATLWETVYDYLYRNLRPIY